MDFRSLPRLAAMVLLLTLLSVAQIARASGPTQVSQFPGDSILVSLRHSEISSASSWADIKRIQQRVQDSLFDDLCVKREVLAALELESMIRNQDIEWPLMEEFIPEMLGDCQQKSLLLSYLVANFLLTEAKFEEGIRQLEGILNATTSSSLKVDCLNNIGVAQIYLGELENAVESFNEMTAFGEHLSALNWNNVAVAFLDAGDWRRAETFIRRALDAPDVDELTSLLLQFNYLQVQMMKGELENGQVVLDQINLEELFSSTSSVPLDAESKHRCGLILLEFLMRNDDLAKFRRHENAIAQFILASVRDASDLSVAFQLLLPPYRFEVQSRLEISLEELWWLACEILGRQVSSSFQANAQSHQPEDSQSQRSIAWFWGAVGALTLAGAAGFMGFRVGQKRRQTAAVREKEAVEHTFKLPKSNQSLKVELMRLIAHLPESDQLVLTDFFRKQHRLYSANRDSKIRKMAVHFQLTNREERLVELMALGYKSKDIAKIMDLSNSYVYNLRTEVRTKCNIPHKTKLHSWVEAWLHSESEP